MRIAVGSELSRQVTPAVREFRFELHRSAHCAQCLCAAPSGPIGASEFQVNHGGPRLRSGQAFQDTERAGRVAETASGCGEQQARGRVPRRNPKDFAGRARRGGGILIQQRRSTKQSELQFCDRRGQQASLVARRGNERVIARCIVGLQ